MPYYGDQLKPRTTGRHEVKPRRPKNYSGFDLIPVYNEAVSRSDDWRLIEADQRTIMELLVNGFLYSTLQSFVKRTVSEVGQFTQPSPEETDFVRAMVNKFPTLANVSEITALSNILRVKGLQAYYTEDEIAKYICKVFINRMHRYGAYAKIEHGDVALYMAQKVSRQKALELVESIET